MTLQIRCEFGVIKPCRKSIYTQACTITFPLFFNFLNFQTLIDTLVLV